VRFISATNKNLIKLVNEGKFREDLFYRLNVFYLFLPPLRDRRETIPNLVRLFVHKHNNLLNKRVSKISKGAELSLATYNYPGNVRELENIIEHAMVLVQGNEIQESDLPEFMHRQQLLLTAAGQTPELIEDNVRPAAIIPLEQVEKEHIQRALAVHNYNFSETAKKLGVSRSTLWRKIRQYKLGAEGTPEKGEGSENATNGHA
jgi:transcriptional regulator with PAS, ATPase and Fis domain